jgi:hypothetical protein
MSVKKDTAAAAAAAAKTIISGVWLCVVNGGNLFFIYI